MPDPERSAETASIRLDKWLWHARFFKSRSLAAEAVSGGRMRLNSQVVGKPAQPVRAGDVLTFTLGRRVVVVRILAPGTRRGPAPEARTLYEDLSEAYPPQDLSAPQPADGGRPRGPGPRSLSARPPGRVD